MRYWMAALVAALLVAVTVATLLLVPAHPAEGCAEDGAWVAVDHHSRDAVEDSHGVSRACRSIDDLIDTAFEVAIQRGVIQFAPPGT